MKITNNQIKILINQIASQELEVSEASARRRIFRSLADQNEDIDILQRELAEKYGTKKEHGNQYELDINGNIKLSKESSIKFRNDFKKVLDEEFEITITDKNKKDWQTIKTILKNIIKTKTKPKMNAQNFDLVESLNEIVEIIK